MVNHPNRSKRTKVVRLTHDEVITLLSCIRIAAEDGSIYGGQQPGDGEWEATSAELDAIEAKLKAAR